MRHSWRQLGNWVWCTGAQWRDNNNNNKSSWRDKPDVVTQCFTFNRIFWFIIKKGPYIHIKMSMLLPPQPITLSALQADSQQSVPRRQLAEAPLVSSPHPPGSKGLHGSGEHQEGLAERRRLLYLWRLNSQGRLCPGATAHLQVRGRSGLSKSGSRLSFQKKQHACHFQVLHFTQAHK